MITVLEVSFTINKSGLNVVTRMSGGIVPPCAAKKPGKSAMLIQHRGKKPSQRELRIALTIDDRTESWRHV